MGEGFEFRFSEVGAKSIDDILLVIVGEFQHILQLRNSPIVALSLTTPERTSQLLHRRFRSFRIERRLLLILRRHLIYSHRVTQHRFTDLEVEERESNGDAGTVNIYIISILLL